MSAKNRQFIFWQTVFAKDPAECWNWPGATDDDGYGGFSFDGHEWQAHRIAWLFAFGEIPDGLKVCHSCDNPACVNPHHLFLGTSADNSADAARKDRMAKKLSAKEVAQIREMLKNTQMSQSQIAKVFRITQSNVSRIKTRQRRQHL